MNKFLLSEKFRLELRWEDVLYEQPGKCKLVGGYFTGPVLQIAQKIIDNDYGRCRHQDASFREYGFGATMIFIA